MKPLPLLQTPRSIEGQHPDETGDGDDVSIVTAQGKSGPSARHSSPESIESSHGRGGGLGLYGRRFDPWSSRSLMECLGVSRTNSEERGVLFDHGDPLGKEGGE